MRVVHVNNRTTRWGRVRRDSKLRQSNAFVGEVVPVVYPLRVPLCGVAKELR